MQGAQRPLHTRHTLGELAETRSRSLFALECVGPSPINTFLISSPKKSTCLERVLPLPQVISCPAAQELHISRLGVLWDRGRSPEGTSLWPGWADVGSSVPTALVSLPGVCSEWQDRGQWGWDR